MAKGVKTGGGSRKGKPNKITASVKASILEAFEKVGGVDYLCKQAEANPTAFLSLLGRILPTQTELTGKDGQELIPKPDLSKLSHDQLRTLAAIKLATDGG